MSDKYSVDNFPDLQVALNAAYLPYLNQHIKETQLHLLGHPESRFYDPSSHWSEREKSLFFHALSVHSRLRPDLIAQEVGSKGVGEVCAYLVNLEAGVEAEGDSLDRRDIECAMEVSEECIGLEEDNCAALVESEAQWKTIANDVARDKERRAKKRELMPRVPKVENSNSQPEQPREQARAEFKQWWKLQKLKNEAEDILQSLGEVHFKVLDHILREGYDPETQPATADETSRQGTTEPSLTPQVEDGSAESLEAMLSPTSRRRVQKRLYMRRKRGRSTEELELGREKPGRKSRPRKRRKKRDGSVDTDNDEGSGSDGEAEDKREDSGDEEEEDTRHPNVGGKTKHYRLKARFETAGFNAEGLRARGLGLFHFSALGKLMKMYNLLHPVPSSLASAISADTIQLLEACVMRYVTQLVHRAIVSREVERGMKGHTKVWRFDSEQVLAPTVDHAVGMMGVAVKSRKNFMQEVFERLGVDGGSDNEESGSDSEEGVRQKEGEGEKHEVGILQESLHRGMYTPLVRLPPSLRPSLPYHKPQGHSEDPLLSSEMDEDALVQELEEEETLDEEDLEKAREEENVLWGELGGGRAKKEEDDEYTLMSGRGRGFKSEVYIDDSD